MYRILIVLLFLSPMTVRSEVAFEAWARATPPGATTGAVYGLLTNTGSNQVRAERISVDFARHVMTHKTVEIDGVMKMKHADLVIPAGGQLELAPGALHIMLMGLSKPLKQDCEMELEIHWDDATEQKVIVRIGHFGQMTIPTAHTGNCVE